jgi:serine/threonine-protein kinase
MEKIFENRYFIESELTSKYGAIFSTFRAKDTLENKLVIIKILKDEFADDQEIKKRFLEYYQNVLINIKDTSFLVKVTQVSNVQSKKLFLVREYVEGTTLQSLIESGSEMTIENVMPILKQVCQALHSLHLKGLSHYNIAPDNIIITANKSIKVLSYGSLYPIIENTQIIQDLNLADNKYIAPELISGSESEELTIGCDIYSLGRLLETIPIPFNKIIINKAASSTPSHRYQNLQEFLKDIEKNPLSSQEEKLPSSAVPSSQSTNKESETPQDKTQIISGITDIEKDDNKEPGKKTTKELETKQEGKPVVNPDSPGSSGSESKTVQKYQKQISELENQLKSEQELVQKLKQNKQGEESITIKNLRNQIFALESQLKNKEEIINKLKENKRSEDDDIINKLQNQISELKKTQKSSKLIKNGVTETKAAIINKTLVISSIILFLLLIAASVIIFSNSNYSDSNVLVPDVTGLNISEAINRVNASGLNYKILKVFSVRTSPGKVENQYPLKNVKVKKNSFITLQVAEENNMVTVPDLTGMNINDASKLLSNVGLEYNIDKKYSQNTQSGTITAQSPTKSNIVKKGTSITLQVAQENNSSNVPDLTGINIENAKNILVKAGLRFKVVKVYFGIAKRDLVVEQIPAPNTILKKDDLITLQVGE